jgi:type VI protein secretion system component Hcp
VETVILLILYGLGGAGASHPLRGEIEVDSVAWGFDRTPGSGTFEYGRPVLPSVVAVTMRTGSESPQLMNRFLNRHVIDTGFIRAIQPDVNGVEQIVATVTLHDIRVVEFGQHSDGAGFTNTAHLSFSALEYDYPPGPTAAFSLPT